MSYTIKMTPEQVAAFKFVDGFTWHGFYDANNLLPDNVPSESHMEEMDCEPDDIRKMVVDASVSSFNEETGELTLVKGSQLEDDVRYVLEDAVSNLTRIMTGPGRVRCIENILRKMPA